jgi:hypothetical protein
MMVAYKGTYSPDDDKLRLYEAGDPDPDIRASAKSRGFVWSAKQQAFVAPRWTPEREDLLLQLCGEIGVELGAEEVDLVAWAERHSRRIGMIEADKRKQQQVQSESKKLLKMWRWEIFTRDQAEALASRDHLRVRFEGDSTSVRSVWSGLVRRAITLREARNASIRAHEMAIVRAQRWIDHHEKRLAYARALLARAGGGGANQAVPEVGGARQPDCIPQAWNNPSQASFYVGRLDQSLTREVTAPIVRLQSLREGDSTCTRKS